MSWIEKYPPGRVKKDHHLHHGGFANQRVAGLPGLPSGMSTDHPARRQAATPQPEILL
jgi:hypothetical protein